MAIIDDATRLVVQAEFYQSQKLPVLEDALRKAIIRCGAPDNLYVDNGKIFVSQWLRLACAKLRIRHLNTKAYSPESKGKIERFNRTVEEFLEEAQLEKPQTLEHLIRCSGPGCRRAITTGSTPPWPVKARLRPSPRILNP